MDELDARIAELFTGADGLNCAQAIMQLSLELRGEHNPGLIRALGGLGGGLGCGKSCGTLLGGCCLLASYGARGALGERERFDCRALVAQLVAWFEQAYGSTDCRDLVAPDPMAIMDVCPGLIRATFLRCMDILNDAGVDPAE
ncbi:MAG: C_GCAxxG_C_C family protein [Clostridiales bacterium]|nr:C_GCAxxG_C_C family protein [Clostridiales bacterium]